MAMLSNGSLRPQNDVSILRSRYDGEEGAPLLEVDTNTTSRPSHTPSTSTSTAETSVKRRILLLVGLLVLTFETGNAMRTPALISSLEEAVCNQLHSTALRPTQACSKNRAVESEVAMVLGVSQFLETLPVLLLSGIYGSIADQYGRRPVLLLGYLGMILSSTWVTSITWLAPSVPIRLIWLGPLFYILGGGPSVPISILMTTAADVVSSHQRVSVFSFIHGTALSATLLGSMCSTILLISMGNFPPLLLGLGLMCVPMALGIFLPSTMQATAVSSRPSGADWTSESSVDSQDSISSQQHQFRKGEEIDYHAYRKLWQIRSAMPLLIAGFLSMLGQQVQVLILQYVPNRFNTTLAKANLFNVLNSAVNLLVLFILLPLTSTLLLRRFGWTAFHKDIVLTHASSFLFIIGAVILATAPVISAAVSGLVIFGTGIGLSSLLRSIFVGLFPPEDAAFATTMISAAKAVGGTVSGPVYSYAFAKSLDQGHVFRGLPFFVSAACFAMTELLIMTVNTRKS